MLQIPATSEKGHKTRVLPLTPDFAKFLAQTPERQRHGYVFDPLPMLATNSKKDKLPGRMKLHAVSRRTMVVSCLAKGATGTHAARED